MKDKNLARISEIFTSVQGEGIHQGLRQIFVRFSGCKQSCNFCICGSDNVILSNGSKKKIKDLGKNDKLIAFDETKKIPKNTVIDKIFQGESEEIYKLELEGGNKLKITGGHSIFTKRGWIKVKDLKSTDEVLTIER